MNERGDLPRPSGRPRHSRCIPSSPVPVGPVDDVSARLERFAASTHVAPRADLAERVHARLAMEPGPTPPRRFLVAVGALAPRPALAAFRQSLGAALGRGRFPMVVRAQALGLVLLVVLSVGALGAGGAVLLAAVVQQRVQPTPSIPLPKASPSPTDAARPPAQAPIFSSSTASSPAPSSAPTHAVTTDTGFPPPTPVPSGPSVRPSVQPGPTQLPTPRPLPTPPASHPPSGPHPTPPASHSPSGPHPTPPASHPPSGPHPTPRPHHPPSGPHPTPRGSHPSTGQQPILPPSQPPPARARRRRCVVRRVCR